MSKKHHKTVEDDDTRISWDRAARIFRYAPPPKAIWEVQFDYMPEKLQQLSQTPYSEIDFSDLWYYLGDLTYCELQQDLFDYLFPVCLMDWHFTLQRNESCEHEFEFHRAMRCGNIFQKMMDDSQRQQVFEFFRDSFLERIDSEIHPDALDSDGPNLAWLLRFNSLGMVMPGIDLIWNPWWKMETPGSAIAALEYCAGFMYLDGDNPFFSKSGLAPLPIFCHDSYNYDTGWIPDNLDFLKSHLTIEFFEASLFKALARLHGHQHAGLARQLLDDFPICRGLVADRIRELPSLLATAEQTTWTGRFEY